MTVDASGNAYVTGITDSLDFPRERPLQSSPRARVAVFATKLNPAGSGLVYSTYLGGTGNGEFLRVVPWVLWTVSD